MSDSKSLFPFGSMMPGFDFMKQLATGAGGTTATQQNWIAPTVDVEELDRRIQELKTVLFWLEQNQLGVKSTIQALEVQKMTLQTLQGMNLGLTEIARAFTLPAVKTQEDADNAKAASAQDARARTEDPIQAEDEAGSSPATQPMAGMVDALQWWNALGQQFQQIAAQAMQEAARRATPPPADPKAAKAASASSHKKSGTRATKKSASAKKTSAVKSGQAGEAKTKKSASATRKSTKK